MSHCTCIEVKAEVLELRKVIEGLREKVKEAEKVKESPATKLQVRRCRRNSVHN